MATNPKRISLKSMTINQLSVLTEQFKELDDKNDFQVLLLTPFGFIKGDLHEIASEEELIQKNPDQENQFSVDLSALITLRSNHIRKLEEEVSELKIVDNGAALNLKNVEVYKDLSQGPIMNTNQLIVFADQVISFSLTPRHLSE